MRRIFIITGILTLLAVAAYAAYVFLIKSGPEVTVAPTPTVKPPKSKITPSVTPAPTPTPVLPEVDPSLPVENGLIIDKIGVRGQIHEGSQGIPEVGSPFDEKPQGQKSYSNAYWVCHGKHASYHQRRRSSSLKQTRSA